MDGESTEKRMEAVGRTAGEWKDQFKTVLGKLGSRQGCRELLLPINPNNDSTDYRACAFTMPLITMKKCLADQNLQDNPEVKRHFLQLVSTSFEEMIEEHDIPPYRFLFSLIVLPLQHQKNTGHSGEILENLVGRWEHDEGIGRPGKATSNTWFEFGTKVASQDLIEFINWHSQELTADREADFKPILELAHVAIDALVSQVSVFSSQKDFLSIISRKWEEAKSNSQAFSECDSDVLVALAKFQKRGLQRDNLSDFQDFSELDLGLVGHSLYAPIGLWMGPLKEKDASANMLLARHLFGAWKWYSVETISSFKLKNPIGDNPKDLVKRNVYKNYRFDDDDNEITINSGKPLIALRDEETIRFNPVKLSLLGKAEAGKSTFLASLDNSVTRDNDVQGLHGNLQVNVPQHGDQVRYENLKKFRNREPLDPTADTHPFRYNVPNTGFSIEIFDHAGGHLLGEQGGNIREDGARETQIKVKDKVLQEADALTILLNDVTLTPFLKSSVFPDEETQRESRLEADKHRQRILSNIELAFTSNSGRKDIPIALVVNKADELFDLEFQVSQKILLDCRMFGDERMPDLSAKKTDRDQLIHWILYCGLGTKSLLSHLILQRAIDFLVPIIQICAPKTQRIEVFFINSVDQNENGPFKVIEWVIEELKEPFINQAKERLQADFDQLQHESGKVGRQKSLFELTVRPKNVLVRFGYGVWESIGNLIIPIGKQREKSIKRKLTTISSRLMSSMPDLDLSVDDISDTRNIEAAFLAFPRRLERSENALSSLEDEIEHFKQAGQADAP